MERKRKIGNDIGVIVFKEGETPFQPDYQASKVNQVIGVTGFDQAIADRTFYRFTVTSKKEVGSFIVVFRFSVFVSHSLSRRFRRLDRI